MRRAVSTLADAGIVVSAVVAGVGVVLALPGLALMVAGFAALDRLAEVSEP